MTTTHQALPTVDHVGRAITNDPANHRAMRGIALRNAGYTWRRIADELGYTSAARAENGVMRCVAWLNGNHSVTPRRSTRTPAWALTRSFGVEIEFVGPTMFTVARAIEDVVGYPIAVNGYHTQQSRQRRGGDAYGQWTCESDGSVTSRGRGGEVVSPILSGEAGMNELKAVMVAIRSVGGRVSVRTGMHVHVDARDLTGEQIGRLICAYADRQNAFDQFVSPSRRSDRRNHYCMALGESEKREIKDSFTATKTAPVYAQRYRTVNCTAFGVIGTIEFRQHQGSLNGAKSVAWIETLLALTNSVLATEDESLPTDPTELVESLAAFGMSRAAVRQMKGRVN